MVRVGVIDIGLYIGGRGILPGECLLSSSCSVKVGSSILRTPWPMREGCRDRRVSHTLWGPLASPAWAVRAMPCSLAYWYAGIWASSGSQPRHPRGRARQRLCRGKRSTSLTVCILCSVLKWRNVQRIKRASIPVS